MHRLRNVSGGSGNPRTAKYLNKSIAETFDDTPLDDNGEISVERFFDIRTSKLKPDSFKHIYTYIIGPKEYKVIRVPGCTNTFVVDFKNRISFRGLEKGTGFVKKIATFGNRTIAIIEERGDYRCIDDKGNQVTVDCEEINLIKQENIDILECIQEEGPIFYLGSDRKYYRKIDGQGKGETPTFEKRY